MLNEILKRYYLFKRGPNIGFIIDRIVFASFLMIFPIVIYYNQNKTITTLFNYQIGFINFIIYGAAIYIFGSSILTYVGKSYITEIRQGTFESMIITPFSRVKYFFGSLFFQLIFSLFEFMIIILIGSFFSESINININTFIPLIFLIILSFFSFSILLSSVMIQIRDSFIIMNTISYLILLTSGVLFPISFLPSFLQYISFLLPMTYSIELFRTQSLNNKTYIFLIILLSFIYITIGLLWHQKLEKKMLGEIFC